MIMRYFTFNLFAILISISVSNGQTFDEMPKIIPPSPTAFDFGKINNSNNGLFTGTIEQNITLFEFESGDISVPISLNYQSNGIKVDQLENRVGLGWNLSVGGVITRIVRDQPDEENYGYFPSQDIINFQDFFTVDYFYKSGKGVTDTESDIFYYNFNGYNGKFVYGNDKSIVLIPHTGIKIYPQINGNDLTYLIITPDGVRYYFEETEKNMTRVEGSTHSEYSDETTTSWFLSKIIDIKGNEIIFEYVNENYSYLAGRNENVKIAFPDFQNVCNNTLRSYPEITKTTLRSTISSKFLTKIYSTNPMDGFVEFFSNKINQNTTGQKILTEIQLKDYQYNMIENYKLDYIENQNKRIFLSK